jgi:hypothetical protein
MRIITVQEIHITDHFDEISVTMRCQAAASLSQVDFRRTRVSFPELSAVQPFIPGSMALSGGSDNVEVGEGSGKG